LKSATARRAKALYELATAEGVPQCKKIHLRRDRLPSEELASLVGTVRVHVSRGLNALASAGAIRVNREVISIADLELLELLREGVDVRFGFLAKHRGIWPVVLMCEVLDVSRSGFYAWLSRPRSRRSQEDEVLGGHVRQSFVGSDRTYGARRVWHDVLALGLRVPSCPWKTPGPSPRAALSLN
jgi:hypothetical protein